MKKSFDAIVSGIKGSEGSHIQHIMFLTNVKCFSSEWKELWNIWPKCYQKTLTVSDEFNHAFINSIKITNGLNGKKIAQLSRELEKSLELAQTNLEAPNRKILETLARWRWFYL